MARIDWFWPKKCNNIIYVILHVFSSFLVEDTIVFSLNAMVAFLFSYIYGKVFEIHIIIFNNSVNDNFVSVI